MKRSTPARPAEDRPSPIVPRRKVAARRELLATCRAALAMRRPA